MSIKVSEKDGYRYIETSSGLFQGVMNIDKPDEVTSPFCRYVIEEINSFPKDKGIVAILGMGTGTIPKAIRDDIHLVIVEIDGEMLDISSKYFNYVRKDNHFVVIEDAKDWVQRVAKPKYRRKYDVVVVDLFDGVQVPNYFKTEHFFKMLSRITKRVIVNSISTENRLDFKFEDYFKGTSYNIGDDKEVYWSLLDLHKL